MHQFKKVSWFLGLAFTKNRAAVLSMGLALSTALIVLIFVSHWTDAQREWLKQERDTLAGQVAALEKNATGAPTADKNPDRLVNALPLSRDTVELATLHDAAKRHGLVWVDAKYRESAMIDGRVKRLDIDVPLSGSYLAVQAFLAESLNAHQNVAVRQLSLRRIASGADIEAQLQLSVFYRTP